MSKYCIVKTVVEEFQDQADVETKISHITDGKEAKEKVSSEFLQMLEAELKSALELDSIFLVWDGEDIADEDSELYGIESVFDDSDYAAELKERGRLVYCFEDGLCNRITTSLQVVEMPE